MEGLPKELLLEIICSLDIETVLWSVPFISKKFSILVRYLLQASESIATPYASRFQEALQNELGVFCAAPPFPPNWWKYYKDFKISKNQRVVVLGRFPQISCLPFSTLPNTKDCIFQSISMTGAEVVQDEINKIFENAFDRYHL
jgi:hypothetical protein